MYHKRIKPHYKTNKKIMKACLISNNTKKQFFLSAFQKEGAKEEEPNEPGKRALLSLKSKACWKIAQKWLFTEILCSWKLSHPRRIQSIS